MGEPPARSIMSFLLLNKHKQKGLLVCFRLLGIKIEFLNKFQNGAESTMCHSVIKNLLKSVSIIPSPNEKYTQGNAMCNMKIQFTQPLSGGF